MPKKKTATRRVPAGETRTARRSLPCVRPCFVSEYRVETGVGGKTKPFHWIFNADGYPIVNVALQFRGPAGKSFQVQLRHHHPAATVGPTCTYVIERKQGALGPAGFELIEFPAVRPRLPVLDIIAFGDVDPGFDTVACTVYATVA